MRKMTSWIAACVLTFVCVALGYIVMYLMTAK